MANSVKYNASAESLALNTGDFWIGTGDVAKGPTSTTDFWSAINPSNIDNDFADGYTIYVNKASQGPSIRVASSDAELITITNQISGNSYATINDCFDYFITQDDKFVLNSYINPIITEGLRYYLDASLVPSYPRSGNDTYDLSGYAQDMTLSNSTFLNKGIEFNGTTTEAQGQLSNINVDANKTVLEVLFKPMDLSEKQAIFTDNYGPEYGIWINGPVSDTYRIYGYAYTGGGGLYSDVIEIGRWYHVVLNIDPELSGSSDPTYRSMYINGELIGNRTSDTGNGLTDRPFTLGFDRRGDDPDLHFFSGSIDSVKIYYGEHGLTEVSQNYYQSKIVTDGLVFAIDAGNLVSYEDGSSTTYSLINSYTGDLSGVTYNGSTGGTWNFDGSSDKITIPYDSYWDTNVFGEAEDFTIMCWTKCDNFYNHSALIEKAAGGYWSQSQGASLWANATGFVGVFGNGATGNPSGWGFNIHYPTDNTTDWFHVAFTGDGEYGTFYINGVYVDSKLLSLRSATVETTTDPPRIGVRPASSWYEGQIPTMKFYDRGLTAAEVAQNYGAGKGRFSNVSIAPQA